jgi:TolA-binding protein
MTARHALILLAICVGLGLLAVLVALFGGGRVLAGAGAGAVAVAGAAVTVGRTKRQGRQRLRVERSRVQGIQEALDVQPPQQNETETEAAQRAADTLRGLR